METLCILGLVTLAFLVILTGGPRVAASANKPGVGGRLYYNTGSYGSPTWTHFDFAKDVTFAMPWTMAEAGGRFTKNMNKMKTRTEIQCQVTAKADDADTAYQAFRTAAASQTVVVDVLCLDGLISVEGCRGFRGECLVNLTGQPQEIDGSIYDTFDLHPTQTTNADGPSTVVMASASSITATAL